MPLQDLIGVLPLYAEDLGESSAETLALRWLLELCAGLGELHHMAWDMAMSAPQYHCPGRNGGAD
ncbi:MAG: hypothetical protein IPL99_26330 [Candidatus Competibacteraceae bacterium]|nr:hypothetical protein [Candidatus Competibacteraceae bacterium]